jgi:hypothetical protein
LKKLGKVLKGTSLFVLGALTATTISVAAQQDTRTIDVSYKNIKICVDGNELTPKDSNDNVVEPFIYNGSTYLPVRAVAEATGKSVSYDGETNTVYIGKKSTGTILGKDLKSYKKNGLREEPVTVEGVEYENALNILVGITSSDSYYNLNGEYNTLTTLFACPDDNTGGTSCDVEIYGDDELITTLKCVDGKAPQKVQIDVTGVKQLKITHGGGYAKGCLLNPTLN